MPYKTMEQRKEQARLRREAGLCVNCGSKAQVRRPVPALPREA